MIDPLRIPTRDEFDALHNRSPKAAAEALTLVREAARRNYACFLRYWLLATRAPFQWNWHWHYLADIMQAVADRDPQVRFLIVNIPPRFAKSTLLSQLWQAWMLGREDNRRSSLFSMTTSGTLAARDSRKTLDTIRAPWYQTLFPTVAIGAKETELEWETKGGAYRLACGAGGTVTGRGADHLLWDDLLKADEANSETVREKINEWLGETLRSRLDDQKEGTITGIQQRLHERDPTGYLLEQMRKSKDADRYNLICLPHEAPSRTVVTFNDVVYAIREKGDLLHPERIGPQEAAALRAALKHNYSGQYQQQPVKMVGGHLDPRRLVRLKGTALELKSSLGLTPTFILDFAATEKQTQKDDPDFNVVGVGAKDQLGRLIILDMWKKQTADYDFLARTVLNMAKIWRPNLVRGEKGAMFNQFQSAITRVSRLMGVYVALFPTKARTTDKMSRSFAYQGLLNAGIVCVPEDAPWLADFEAEHRAFPNGTHDDQCLASDTCVLCSNGWKPISAIKAGEQVWTRRGLRQVLWAGQTGVAKIIHRFGLTGTPNHPVWTENRGWTPLASLLPSDDIVCVDRGCSSLGAGTIAIQTVRVETWRLISTAMTDGSLPRALSTGMSGWQQGGQSLRAGMSTIKTALTTIGWKAWSAYRLWRMVRGIAFAQIHGPGISEPGLVGTACGRGRSAWQPSERHEGPLQPSVALPSESERDWHDRSSQPAQTVARNINTTTQGEPRKHAAPAVESISVTSADTSLVPVFNLTVDGEPEFFANGILVHNCDVCFDFGAYFDELRLGEAPIVNPTDPQQLADEDYKRRIEAAVNRERNPAAEDDWKW